MLRITTWFGAARGRDRVRVNAPDLEPGGPGVMVTVAAMMSLA